MRTTPLYITLFSLAFLGIAAPAHANYFVWQDPDTGASLTFPDTWRTINNQKPDDLVTIIAPVAADRPICRLRARADQRFTYYPATYAPDVQRFAYGDTFWPEYTAEYDNVTFETAVDDVVFGGVPASMAVANFTDSAPRNEAVIRTGQFWAGLAYDTAFILDCSATRVSFGFWQSEFLKIAQSVNVPRPVTNPVTGGYRRDFIRTAWTYDRVVP
jgi:hypothetical protein